MDEVLRGGVLKAGTEKRGVYSREGRCADLECPSASGRISNTLQGDEPLQPVKPLLFAVILPGAPGLFGTIQAAFVFALTPFGVAKEAALAASIVFLLAQWVPITLVGAFFFATARANLGDLQKQVAELREEKEAGGAERRA